MTSSAASKERTASGQRSVCVAVTGETAEELIARSASLLPDFPFQEFRLDFLRQPVTSLEVFRAHLAAFPDADFLATCRRTGSGGRFQGSPEEEMHVLLAAARLGFRLVDLAVESAEALPSDAVSRLRAAGAVVLLSWHDFTRTGDLRAVLERMRPFAPDVCKIVPTACTLDDSVPLLQLLQDRGRLLKNQDREEALRPRLVGVSMGEPGVLTRVLGVRSGSAFTFAAATPAEATAPGQIAARTLRELYRIDEIDGQTLLYGVAGHPIRSSLSPLMLNTAFRGANLNAVYLPLLTDSAAELFRVARALPLAGFSVTMPLKQSVVPLLDHLDPLAAKIGAVNTVRREADGSYSGFNTDAAGITAPLQQRLFAQGRSLHGARVLVLGAGGAARAAVFACTEKGAEVSILNRTFTAAAKLAEESGATPMKQEDLAHIQPFDVLIHATPAGMDGDPTAMPLAPDQLRAKLVFDLVYNPLETPLLGAATARGIETISGMEMFVHQGAHQFALWTGKAAPLDIMRSIVTDALRTRQRAAPSS